MFAHFFLDFSDLSPCRKCRKIVARLSMAIPDGSPCIRITLHLFYELANENALLRCQRMLRPTHPVGSSFSRDRLREKKSKSLNRWGRSKCHRRVRQIHLRRSLRLLSNQSGPDERMFCITVVRKDPTCPNRSESLLFHGSVLASVHVHLSHALDFQLHCVFTQLRRKRCTCQSVIVHAIVIGHSLQDRVLPL